MGLGVSEQVLVIYSTSAKSKITVNKIDIFVHISFGCVDIPWLQIIK